MWWDRVAAVANTLQEPDLGCDLSQEPPHVSSTRSLRRLKQEPRWLNPCRGCCEAQLTRMRQDCMKPETGSADGEMNLRSGSENAIVLHPEAGSSGST